MHCNASCEGVCRLLCVLLLYVYICRFLCTGCEKEYPSGTCKSKSRQILLPLDKAILAELSFYAKLTSCWLLHICHEDKREVLIF